MGTRAEMLENPLPIMQERKFSAFFPLLSHPIAEQERPSYGAAIP